MKKLVAAIFFILCALLQGAPVNNEPQVIVQPDGTELNVLVSGDEYYSYLHDEYGFTIIKDQSTRVYCYAKVSDGELVSSGFAVGSVNPVEVGLAPFASESSDVIETKVQAVSQQKGSRGAHGLVPKIFKSGTLYNIVLFVYFTDTNANYGVPFSSAEINQYKLWYNGEGTQDEVAPQGYLKSYFKENSYNKLIVESYVDLNLQYQAPKDYSFYASQAYGSVEHQNLIHDAIKWAIDNNMIPESVAQDGNGDGIIDNIQIVTKGKTQYDSMFMPVKWWFLSSAPKLILHGKKVYDFTFLPKDRADVNAAAHELTHGCGAPDMYRAVVMGTPTEKWDNLSSLDVYSPPVHNVAWLKYKYLGWIDNIPEVKSGHITLKPLNVSSTESAVKIMPKNSTKEFFIAEYRQKSKYDNKTYGSGLVVYRVNPSLNGNFIAKSTPLSTDDEVYVLRPGVKNNVSNATGMTTSFHSLESGRTEISATAKTILTLSNGTDPGFAIKNISSAGETISFTVEDGNGGVSIDEPTAASAMLLNNYPNPFNPTTAINFNLPQSSEVKLTVLNSKGELVSTLVDGLLNQGSHQINFDGSKLNSGIYFYKVQTNGKSYTNKMVLIK